MKGGGDPALLITTLYTPHNLIFRGVFFQPCLTCGRVYSCSEQKGISYINCYVQKYFIKLLNIHIERELWITQKNNYG